MRSIRFSLVIYFFALLVIGLGGVSALTYGTTAGTLRDKEASARSLVETEFKDRRKELREEFDQHVFARTHTFIRRHSQPARYDSFNSLAMLGAALVPHGYLNIAANLRLGVWPLSGRMPPMALRQLETKQLDELLAALDDFND